MKYFDMKYKILGAKRLITKSRLKCHPLFFSIHSFYESFKFNETENDIFNKTKRDGT